MQYPKRAGFIVAAMCFVLFAACEGERRVGNSSDENPFVQISITQAGTAKMRLGESRTLRVTTTNTDFTLSSPADAGCLKTGVTTVVCTPVSEGKYDIRVTATADTKKSATTTITVEFVSISISPASVSIKSEFRRDRQYEGWEWEQAEFTVNTNGSFSPSAVNRSRHDARCRTYEERPNIVECTPDLAGTYVITVTAADNTTDAAVLTAMIGIWPNVEEVKTKEEVAVFKVNATDFTISTSPEKGITCAKNGKEVVCVPDSDGTYVVTVTAGGDKDNKDEALLIGKK